MDLALYHPEFGYYASSAQRSGRAGDFYTSVDVGPIFGELLAIQVSEMARLVVPGTGEVDLVEAAAGNGRLARDLLDALAREFHDEYARVRVHLVERSPAARLAEAEMLEPHRARVASMAPGLPAEITGIVYANELLDALPVHVVVSRPEGLREVLVATDGTRLFEVEAEPSTAALQEYFDWIGVTPEPGSRAEVNLAAVQWIKDVAHRLERGFVLLLDYGHHAPRLYDATHRDGTLRAFSTHMVGARWLDAPGEQDLTSHVDFTGVSSAAETAGLEVLGIVDQTKFLLGLGVLDRIEQACRGVPESVAVRRRLAARTLLVPGGMGSTHHAMVFAKGLGRPQLKGLSFQT